MTGVMVALYLQIIASLDVRLQVWTMPHTAGITHVKDALSDDRCKV